MSEKQDNGQSRRDFLKLASTSVPAAAAVVALAPEGAEAATAEADGGKMQDTAHTRAYFDSARF